MIFLTVTIQVLLLVAFAWAVCLTLIGLCWKKPQQITTAKQSRFAVVICAHNEENVISQLLDSLEDQDYPKDMRKIFLFADHCDDGTAQEGRKNSQVEVYERKDGPRSGKGAVLQWGLNIIKEKYGGSFTHVVVFDADNKAAPDFLTRMDETFAAGAKLVMGNRQALNPYASVISGWYTLYWQTVDILYCKPRSNLGFSAILSGTGFGFAWELLGSQGWQTSTITEDIEFSMQQNLKGVFAVYQEKACFFDEQPTNFPTLLSQLRRWCTGNYQIFTRYKKLWWQHFYKEPSIKLLDNFIPIGLCAVFGFYVLLSASWIIYNAIHGFTLFNWWDLLWWGGLYGVSIAVGSWSTVKGEFSFPRMLPSILTSGIYCIIFSLVAVYSIFCPVGSWRPIKHTGKK